MTISIRWADNPPQGSKPFVPIWSPRPGEPVTAIVTSAGIIGVLTHFLHNRTIPCILPVEECEGHRAHKPTRWKGYLAALSQPLGRVGLVEVTHEAVMMQRKTIVALGNLRGYLVTTTRHGKAVNGRVSVDFRSYWNPDDPRLPGALNVKAALLRIWDTEVGAAIHRSRLPLTEGTNRKPV
jgi:hypothetical protein